MNSILKNTNIVSPAHQTMAVEDPKMGISNQIISMYLLDNSNHQVSKIYKQVSSLKENEFLHIVKNDKEALVGKVAGVWTLEQITQEEKGGFATVKLTNSFALRSTKKTSTLEDTISQRTSTSVGVMPPPIGFVKQVYYVETGESLECSSPLQRVNKRCKSDLQKNTYSKEEIPMLCAYMTLGLKALHEANLHHLDIKPANILYDGDGVAYITDFDGTLKSDFFDFSHKPHCYTPYMIRVEDIRKLQGSWAFSSVAKKIDIFALGSTFYQIAIQAKNKDTPSSFNPMRFIYKHIKIPSLPYTLVNKYPGKLYNKKTLVKNLQSIYTQEEIEMILRMLATDINKRPTIQEVSQVFSLEKALYGRLGSKITSQDDFANKCKNALFRIAAYLTYPAYKSKECFQMMQIIDELYPETTTLGKINNVIRKWQFLLSSFFYSGVAIFANPLSMLLHYLTYELSSPSFLYEKGNIPEKTFTKKSFSLLSWNIGLTPGGETLTEKGLLPGSYRIEKITSQILKQDADVVCLYEVFDKVSLINSVDRLKKTYPHIYIPIDSNAFDTSSGILIASKFVLTNFDKMTLPKPINNEKSAISFTLLSPPKKRARIIAAYIPQQKDPHLSNQQQAKDTLQKIKQIEASTTPTILCGSQNLFKDTPINSTHYDEELDYVQGVGALIRNIDISKENSPYDPKKITWTALSQHQPLLVEVTLK